ncbi:MAG: methyl-accepting chemotaxis protein [Oscillospiraceae bacterium]|nr:methyl-accepting chemotaxis protein [Oscillospiraceae bacterium]
MQKLHKINVIILWICAFLMIAFITISSGLTHATIVSDAGMVIGIVIITVLYFSKANDIVKGTGITVIIAIACLATSIAQNGNDATFILSFIMMGMALLYFNKAIIISFVAIYIPICIVAGIINPAYVSGPGADMRLCIEDIFGYTVTGVLMIIATNRGGKLVSSSNRMQTRIREDANTTSDVIQQLNISMEQSSQNIGSLTEQIQGISDATFEMETLTKSMNTSANALSALVSDTVNSLDQNVILNKEMEKKFQEVGAAVHNGNDGASEVKMTLDSMKETVTAAGEAAEILLSKISSVNLILKEINKITLRTNMLSINAAIEAAQAGVNGKGFAVVASEIKSLADESSESAKGIQQIISELSMQVEDVAAKTAAGTKSAIAGMESMEKLLVTLNEISSANEVVANVVMQETQTNEVVNNKFETVSSEIGGLVSSVISISQTIESVSADIYRQNDSIKNVNGEIVKMKSVTMSLNRSQELDES